MKIKKEFAAVLLSTFALTLPVLANTETVVRETCSLEAYPKIVDDAAIVIFRSKAMIGKFFDESSGVQAYINFVRDGVCEPAPETCYVGDPAGGTLYSSGQSFAVYKKGTWGLKVSFTFASKAEADEQLERLRAAQICR